MNKTACFICKRSFSFTPVSAQVCICLDCFDAMIITEARRTATGTITFDELLASLGMTKEDLDKENEQ